MSEHGVVLLLTECGGARCICVWTALGAGESKGRGLGYAGRWAFSAALMRWCMVSDL